ncbi:MAG: M23 family metallopeptidase [Puniceicoccales bacterium]|jgi:murein DD-endopeptidase MepM/ murein hydrolase activator NlpD|nr:M23 family metallopeptidase [Puniceicoccales bacterium]
MLRCIIFINLLFVSNFSQGSLLTKLANESSIAKNTKRTTDGRIPPTKSGKLKQGISICWPTIENPILEKAKWTIDGCIQPMESGKLESGKFGLGRQNGTKFHEGIDIKSFTKDKSGKPTDCIYAFMDGKVVYVNASESASAYGRYVVLEHEYFLTLYAHLASINVSVGQPIKAGEKLGILGTSSNCVKIPNTRAHLHFEIDFQIDNGQNFSAWYTAKYNNPPPHGRYNGYNLIGVDPLVITEKLIKKTSPTNVLSDEKEAATIQIIENFIPEFIKQYAELFAPDIDLSKPVCGWEIQFSWFGLPIRWIPIYSNSKQRPKLKLTSYRKSLVKQSILNNVLEEKKSPKGSNEITVGSKIINNLKKMGFATN